MGDTLSKRAAARGLSDSFFGTKFHFQTNFGYSTCCCRTNGGDLNAGRCMATIEGKPLTKSLNSICTRKHKPVELIETNDRLIEKLVGSWWPYFNRGNDNW